MRAENLDLLASSIQNAAAAGNGRFDLDETLCQVQAKKTAVPTNRRDGCWKSDYRLEGQLPMAPAIALPDLSKLAFVS